MEICLSSIADAPGLMRPRASHRNPSRYPGVTSAPTLSVSATPTPVTPTPVTPTPVQSPNICSASTSAIPFGSLLPAPIQFTESKYTAEWIIQSNGIPAPVDAAVSQAGDIFVTVNGGVARVSPDGQVSRLADLCAFAIEIDPAGDLLVFCHVDGVLRRIQPDGTLEIAVQLPRSTPLDSPIAVAADGTIYIALNLVDHTAVLYRTDPGGAPQEMRHDLPHISAMDVDPSGALVVAMSDQILYLSPEDGKTSPIARFPHGISRDGLAIDPNGAIYLANGSREASGGLYRVVPGGEPEAIAAFEENGITGIGIGPSGEIVAAQLLKSELLRIWPDGRVETLVESRGVSTPQAIAFGPTGDLYISNVETGFITRLTPDGKVFKLIGGRVTYTPPLAVLAVAPDGTIYMSEAAPGFPSQIARISPLGQASLFSSEVYVPCGLAFGADGNLYVAETGRGAITRLSDEGGVAAVVEELDTPHYLAVDAAGNFYVAVKDPGAWRGETFQTADLAAISDPLWILKISPDGTREAIADLHHMWYISNMALGSDGHVYVAATGPVGGQIFRVTPQGETQLFASGFRNPAGLAFDLAGNLYVSDDQENSLLRIGGFPQGALTVRVLDPQGNPVAGACVHALTVWPAVVGQVGSTGADGTWSLAAAPRTYSNYGRS